MGSRLDRVTDWEKVAQQAGFRVGQMAEMVTVTRRRLHTYFLFRFERHPDRWLEELRLRIAMASLADGKRSKEIARDIGFESRSAFCRFFRRLTGQTPQIYAKSGPIQDIQLPSRAQIEKPVFSIRNGTWSVNGYGPTTVVHHPGPSFRSTLLLNANSNRSEARDRRAANGSSPKGTPAVLNERTSARIGNAT